MDRIGRPWFSIRNWITSLLLRYFPLNPARSPTVPPANPTAAEAASPREHEPPIVFSPFSAPSVEVNKYYEVFVSFRGEDTRRGFTSHLCDALSSRIGISFVYKDELCLEKGQPIAPELLKGIEDSRVAVVVLSRNYADSTWCLDELVHILHCRKRRDLLVLPIFYQVDPSDVRKQKTGSSFGDAFAKHERVFTGVGGSEKVRKWRDALTEVANLSAFTTAEYSKDSDMIKAIMGKIWKELSPTFPSISMPLVGIDRRVKAVIDLLSLDSTAERNEVRMIGICGMGGSGKTTVAMAAYDTIRSEFEFSTYVSRVREACNTHGGLIQLQKQLFNEIEGNVTMASVQTWGEFGGIERLKRMYRGKKLLLIVDDVTHHKQLQYLAVEHSLFGSGSRVIITSRDQHLLHAQRVDSVYETELLDENEDLVLLCLTAFGQEEPLEDYRYECERILGYAGGLPKAIEVLGCSLKERSVSEWRRTIEKLKRIPPGEILEVLKVGYDALDEEEKEMFLDFVFFFNGVDLLPDPINFLFNVPLMMVQDLYLDEGIGIWNLVDKGLLQVEERYYGDHIYMHHLLEEMGRAIVRSECPDEPGQCSRLTGYQDVCHVLTKGTGSKKLKIISSRADSGYPVPEIVMHSSEAFSRMSNLKVLELRYVKITQGPTYLPDELRILSWTDYPSESLPPSFNPHRLFLLQLDRSNNLKRLWHGNKTMSCLTCMTLCGCFNLIDAPDFTTTPHLEILSLDGCVSLLEVHSSFGRLKNLVFASFKWCERLEVLPPSLETNSLEFLSLQGCSKLKRFPKIEAHMDRLAELSLEGTGIEQLDATIGLLVGLTKLNLGHCKCLTSLPDSLCCLTSLAQLDLNGCCELEDLPSSLRLCVSLEYLRVEDCAKLQSLGELPPNIQRLKAKGCKSLEGIPDTINLRSNGVDIDCRQCFKLDQPESLGWRKLQRYLQGAPNPEQEFGIVTPAGTNKSMDIPEWLMSSGHRFRWGILEPPPDDLMNDVSNPDWIGTVQGDAEEERHIWLSYVPKGSMGYYMENPAPGIPTSREGVCHSYSGRNLEGDGYSYSSVAVED
ncbi:unnamed protein product [Linum tenue]|uniref:TIR domain-containing protein n=1 Tax=Linum tenue TaxID=586396 RepID=A0AAV0IFM1_9ROSI|nr:unnamed protein product [Linum tenue]